MAWLPCMPHQSMVGQEHAIMTDADKGCLREIFLKFSQNFLSKVRLKKFLIDNHYKTIFHISQNGMLFPHRAEVNLRNPLHAGDDGHKRGVHTNFETQNWRHQKPKTGGISGPRKGLISSKKCL